MADIQLVRSECTIAPDNDRATGLRFTSGDLAERVTREALDHILEEMNEKTCYAVPEVSTQLTYGRIAAGLSKAETAARAGLTVQQVEDAENPTHPEYTPMKTITALCEVYGTVDPITIGLPRRFLRADRRSYTTLSIHGLDGRNISDAARQALGQALTTGIECRVDINGLTLSAYPDEDESVQRVTKRWTDALAAAQGTPDVAPIDGA